MPSLAVLLGLPFPSPPARLPQEQRQQMLAALLALLVVRAAQRPLLLILEDLHWGDPSTLELLDRLIDHGPTAAIYTLVTCRPPFQPAWLGRAHVTRLVLDRLARPQAETMVRHVAGQAALPAAVLQHLVAHTDGVPLFIEELTKAVLESGPLQAQTRQTRETSPGTGVDIPVTLQDSLMARLDRLGPAKYVAQVGAVLGREFAYTLLQAVTESDDTLLQQDLACLVHAELLYQHGVPPQATYLFKHALIRDAAYASLLHATRQQVHRRLVTVCGTAFPHFAAIQPELLAHHATAAGLLPEALEFWQRAGTQACQRGAYPEALAHLHQGLAVLARLPDGPERLRHELTLSLALAPVMFAVEGAGSPEVERLASRVYALSQQVEASPQMFPALRGLQYVAWTQGQLAIAQELAGQLLALAQTSADASQLLEAHLALGTTLWSQGRCVVALAHLERGLAHGDPARRPTYERVPHPELACLLYSGLVLWCLGYAAQAQRRIEAGLALAQQLPQPYHLIWAQHLGAFFYRLCRQTPRAQALTDLVVQAATPHGMGWAVAGSLLLQAWERAEPPYAGFAQCQPHLAAYRARSGPLGLAQHLAWLAEGYGQHGQVADGLGALAAAQALVAYTGEQLVRVELHRLHGELLYDVRRQPPASTPATEAAAAEACLRQALTLAQQQQAKTLELRAAVSLSRLWQHQGQGAAARTLLAGVYGWFTEGLDTVDLQEARVLLEMLTSRR